MQPKKSNSDYFSSILSALAFALISLPFLLLGIMAVAYARNNSFQHGLGIVLLVIAAILLAFAIGQFVLSIRHTQNQKAEKEKYGGFTLAQAKLFYGFCLNAGIKDLDSPVNQQKALLMIQSKPEFTAISNIKALHIKMFQAALDDIHVIKTKKETDRVADIRGKEHERFHKEGHLASFAGREKRLFMLREQLNRVRERENVIREGLRQAAIAGAAIAAAHEKKESSWGTLGGIAAGIAGPAAGAAVAIDTMAKNREVRAHNAQVRSAVNSILSSDIRGGYDGLSDLRKQEEVLTKEIAKAQVRLTNDTLTKDEIFASLKITDIVQERTDSGAIIITATVAAAKEFAIDGAEDLETTIDGSIAMQVVFDNGIAGQAYLNLPLYGIGADDAAVKVDGICHTAEQGKTYTINPVPHALWVMER